MRDVELIEDARDDEVDQIVEALRQVVEARIRGHHHRPMRASLSMFSK